VENKVEFKIEISYEEMIIFKWTITKGAARQAWQTTK
jgi:hypothetical protein